MQWTTTDTERDDLQRNEAQSRGDRVIVHELEKYLRERGRTRTPVKDPSLK